MQPEVVQRSVKSTGVLSTSKFHFGAGSEAHIFGLLRNSLYSDKPLALLREYWTNGRDAHVDAFVWDVPVDVALPTDIEPTLVIRDYGFGMSENAIRNTFAAYGASTKRSSNDTVGFMGIGSKSAHSYCDVFTVTSFYMGERTVYNCVIDESGIGDVDKVWVEPCGDETGIEIRIPVLLKDIPAFVRAATYLFTYATPSPNINIPITPKLLDKRANGFLVRRDDASLLPGKWVAVMGSVPYNLDFSRMIDEMKEAGLEEAVAASEGGVYFDIGEVSVSASREELEYTTRTKNAVIANLKLLLEELVGDIDKVISDQLALPWAKRLATRTFHETTKIGVSARYVDWNKEVVEIYSMAPVLDGDGNNVTNAKGNNVTGAPRTFRLHGFGTLRDYYGKKTGMSSKLGEVSSIEVTPSARILIKDTTHVLKSYQLTGDDRVAVPRDGAALSEVEAELRALLDAAGVGGIPVEMLSVLKPSHQVTTRGGGSFNAKHMVRRFVLRDRVSTHTPYSENWDIIDHEPGKDDVFVILSFFEACGESPGPGNFYENVIRDRKVIQFLGGEFPPIYGVKTTNKYPVKAGEVLGTPYVKWRDAYVSELIAQSETLADILEDYFWATLYEGYQYRYWDFAAIHTAWGKHLSEDHPIPSFLQKFIQAKARHHKQKGDVRDVLTSLATACKTQDVARLARQEVLSRYPLLQNHISSGDFSVVTDANKRDPWLEYVRLIDQAKP